VGCFSYGLVCMIMVGWVGVYDYGWGRVGVV